MTIRAKLFAAIALTVLGPLVTIAVALHGQGEFGDRFDEVRDRARQEALARELKFGVTDVNGWQTAYGYDDGRSRPRVERSVAAFRADLREARRTLTDPTERGLLQRRLGREERTRQLLLGPEIDNFEAMGATSEKPARYERRRAAATKRAFDDARDDARKRLIAVALGAAS
jgi:hypothetical protein